MSNWPTAVDYRDALQHPPSAFRDKALQQGVVEANRLKVPKARAGAFANVYKLTTPAAGAVAIRVFLYPQPVRESRYRIVREFIQSRKSRPGCLVRFDYEAEGIRVNNVWYPLLTMEWVKGESLGVWVRNQVAKQDAAALKRMADRWTALLEDLEKHEIAHGDLQHDNVMVVGDEPVLVDYDCMCVPGLVGQPALEEGKPAYQHPRRPGQPLSLDLDRFSAWIILVALRAIACDLSLYKRYVEQPANENLLFCEDDIKQPNGSGLWDELARSRDAEVQGWARLLRKLLPDAKFDDIPPFKVDPWEEVRKARAGDWEEIDRRATRAGQSGRPAPADLAARIDEARRRVASRDRLLQATKTRKVREVVRAYEPVLVDDWPACRQQVEEARKAKAALPLVDRLEAEARGTRDGVVLVQLWDQHKGDLKAWEEAVPLEQKVKGWSDRLAASGEFLNVVNRPGSEKEIAAAWGKLEAVGGHPRAESLRTRAKQAVDRDRCLEVLRAIADDNKETTDRAWQRAWKEDLLKGCRDADPHRDRQARTETRLKLLAGLARAIQEAKGSTAGEQAIVAAAAKLKPPAYEHQARARVTQARTRLVASGELQQALDRQPPWYYEIAGVWQKNKANVVDLDDETRNRCELAVRLSKTLADLKGMPPDLPDDEQDRLWVTLWRKEFERCADLTASHRRRRQEAVERHAAWLALEQCLRAGNLDAIDRLAAHPRLPGYPPFLKHHQQINELKARARHREQLRVLLTRDLDGLSAEDVAFLRNYAAQVVDDRAKLEGQLEDWVLRHVQLRPAATPWKVDDQGLTAKVQWIWPRGDLVSRCSVAVDGERFFQKPGEARVEPGFIDASSYRRDCGKVVQVPEEASEVYVTVWPVLDLGWKEITGKPLHLGPYRAEGAAEAPRPPSGWSLPDWARGWRG